MKYQKQYPEFSSLRNIKIIFNVTILLLICGIMFIVLHLFGEENKEALYTSIVFVCVALVLVFYARRRIIASLKKVFDKITKDIDEEHVLPIIKQPVLSEALFAAAEKMHSCNNDIATKYLLAEAELNALQEQINPHFLYNTLESICGLALTEDAPQVAEITEMLAHMFRDSLRKADTLITLKEEIASIDNYMAIQQFRFPGKFSFFKHIEKEDEQKILSCALPNFTLQPIVENSIYHGLEITSGKGEIHLFASLTGKRLLIRICDNGCGIPQEKLDMLNRNLSKSLDVTPSVYKKDNSSHMGIAMLNINLRIKKTFGNEFGIYIYSTVSVGTDVNIVLPCLWHENNYLGD